MQTKAKIASLIAAKAKRDTLTTQLRDAYGTHVSRKDLREFEKTAGVIVQWVARRDEPVQTFRTPLGFVRSAGARGIYVIPPVAADTTGTTVTESATEFYDSVLGVGGELDEQTSKSELKRKQALGV